MSADREERDESAAPEEEDPGLVGGGGPAATIDELPGPEDEDLHRPDTDHGEL